MESCYRNVDMASLVGFLLKVIYAVVEYGKVGTTNPSVFIVH